MTAQAWRGAQVGEEAGPGGATSPAGPPLARLKERRVAVDGGHVRLVGPTPRTTSAMRYLRVYLGAVRDEPGITLYEIDPAGWVHRMVEIQAHSARFAPEDILMLGRVDPDNMIQHPAAEPFDEAAFDSLWREVRDERPFAGRVPDATLPWEGQVALAGGQALARWCPEGAAPQGWTRVRGFDRLFVQGGARVAEGVARGVFLGAPVRWDLLARAA